MKESRPTHAAGMIFDLDGTLVDTLDDITDSMSAVFGGFDLPPVARERVRSVIGVGLRSLLEKVSGVEDPQRLTALVDSYREVYRKRMLDQTRPFPGVPEMLDQLVGLKIPLAVLSNKPDEFTVPICQALLHRWPFFRWQGAREDRPRKPDPTATLELARDMGCHPGGVYFVGDSSTDVLTGKNAGMIPVAVTWGYRDRGELEAAGPVYLIDDPKALVDLLTRGA